MDNSSSSGPKQGPVQGEGESSFAEYENVSTSSDKHESYDNLLNLLSSEDARPVIQRTKESTSNNVQASKTNGDNNDISEGKESIPTKSPKKPKNKEEHYNSESEYESYYSEDRTNAELEPEELQEASVTREEKDFSGEEDMVEYSYSSETKEKTQQSDYYYSSDKKEQTKVDKMEINSKTQIDRTNSKEESKHEDDSYSYYSGDEIENDKQHSTQDHSQSYEYYSDSIKEKNADEKENQKEIPLESESEDIQSGNNFTKETNEKETNVNSSNDGEEKNHKISDKSSDEDNENIVDNSEKTETFISGEVQNTHENNNTSSESRDSDGSEIQQTRTTIEETKTQLSCSESSSKEDSYSERGKIEKNSGSEDSQNGQNNTETILSESPKQRETSTSDEESNKTEDFLSDVSKSQNSKCISNGEISISGEEKNITKEATALHNVTNDQMPLTPLNQKSQHEECSYSESEKSAGSNEKNTSQDISEYETEPKDDTKSESEHNSKSESESSSSNSDFGINSRTGTSAFGEVANTDNDYISTIPEFSSEQPDEVKETIDSTRQHGRAMVITAAEIEQMKRARKLLQENRGPEVVERSIATKSPDLRYRTKHRKVVERDLLFASDSDASEVPKRKKEGTPTFLRKLPIDLETSFNMSQEKSDTPKETGAPSLQPHGPEFKPFYSVVEGEATPATKKDSFVKYKTKSKSKMARKFVFEESSVIKEPQPLPDKDLFASDTEAPPKDFDRYRGHKFLDDGDDRLSRTKRQKFEKLMNAHNEQLDLESLAERPERDESWAEKQRRARREKLTNKYLDTTCHESIVLDESQAKELEKVKGSYHQSSKSQKQVESHHKSDHTSKSHHKSHHTSKSHHKTETSHTSTHHKPGIRRKNDSSSRFESIPEYDDDVRSDNTAHARAPRQRDDSSDLDLHELSNHINHPSIRSSRSYRSRRSHVLVPEKAATSLAHLESFQTDLTGILERGE